MFQRCVETTLGGPFTPPQNKDHQLQTNKITYISGLFFVSFVDLQRLRVSWSQTSPPPKSAFGPFHCRLQGHAEAGTAIWPATQATTEPGGFWRAGFFRTLRNQLGVDFVKRIEKGSRVSIDI